MELQHALPSYTLNGTTINFHEETIVMGILNVTPDSFSDGGQYVEVERAVQHARQMLADGAHIIDVGGESTRPGHEAVDEEEELKRVIPIIRALHEQLQCIISIDTYKANVAEAAIQAGASIINDIWGAQREPRIAQVAARYRVPIILMHNREEMIDADHFIETYELDLQTSIQIATEAGVPASNIWLDPGVGFAKTQRQNIEVMQHLCTLREWGYPILLGTSRKSLIGYVLDLPVEERLEGSLATVSYGVLHGSHIVRVHDVKETVRTVRMLRALKKGDL